MAEKLKERLKELVGDEGRILEGDFERELFSTDIGEVPFASRLFETTPELVVQPKSVDALKKIVGFANAERVALFPRGSASSGLGGVLPTVKGVILDFSLLKNLSLEKKPLPKKSEREGNWRALKVQAGVRWSEIENFLKSEDFSLRAYPSSFFSTVGGWVATGGYGVGSFRFGHLKEQVESLEVLFPSGEVKTFQSNEAEFERFFGTEGQFGLVLTATLKLRKKPKRSLPRLAYFESCEAAFDFVRDLVKSDFKPKPYHIKYLDAGHLEEANAVLGEDLFAVKEAVLVEFEEEEEEREEEREEEEGKEEGEKKEKEEEEATKFVEFATQRRGRLAEEHLANYLWHERLFPMKRSSGSKPTPLACELVLPLENAVPFLKAAKRVAERCGMDLQAESHILGQKGTGEGEALLILTHQCDARESKTYLLHLSLVPALTRLGLKFGGVPYGVGIWNTPFVKAKFGRTTLKTLKAYKKKVDPRGILNPNKFFAVRTKFWNFPGVVFKPLVFGPLVGAAALATPLFATLLLPAKEVVKKKDKKKEQREESVLERAVYSCVKCGSCAANCPAYLVTCEERVIPKNKLLLAKKLLEGTRRERGKGAGSEVTKSDSDKVFLCTHCEMCQEVCQNDLDLVAAWTELEKLLEDRFGKPAEEKVKEFVAALESSEDYWRLVYEN